MRPAELREQITAALTSAPVVMCDHTRLIEIPAMVDAVLAVPAVADPLARVEQITANLYSYLEQRAAELAQPHIETAEELANRRIATAELEAQRASDLAAERLRQLDARDRQQNRATAAARDEQCEPYKRATLAIVEAVGMGDLAGVGIPDVVAAVARLLTGTASRTERIRAVVAGVITPERCHAAAVEGGHAVAELVDMVCRLAAVTVDEIATARRAVEGEQ